jgi:hypothetical protein
VPLQRLGGSLRPSTNLFHRTRTKRAVNRSKEEAARSETAATALAQVHRRAARLVSKYGPLAIVIAIRGKAAYDAGRAGAPSFDAWRMKMGTSRGAVPLMQV